MTRLALAHYALIATMAFAAGWASRDATVIWASGPEPGWTEREPAPISPVIAEIIDGVARPVHGIRDNGPCGETRPCVGGGGDTTTPVPVPPMLPVFAIALAALIWKGWK